MDEDEMSLVSCCSRRSVNALTTIVEEHIDEIIEQHVETTDEQKSRYRQRFREIFEAAYHENVTVDNTPWAESTSQDDITPVFDPEDVEKRKHVEEVMQIELDETLVNVTKKRKYMPRQCMSQLAKRCLAECNYYNDIQAEVTSSITTTSTVQTDDTSADRLKECASDLAKLKKDVPSTIDKISRLEDARIVSSRVQTSTDNVIFNPIPGETKMADSVTPLRNQIEQTIAPPPPKKLRPDQNSHVATQAIKTRRIIDGSGYVVDQ
ncbi:unnamed protein product [Owenia fusiformis]|uniref:Uncharacterized protein n=1 Tax=Owenia fusiformis TaxID=6347 RepID=A0A8J1U2R8_OWEFU|nr:unnamed protein product [Owenia fusiformis]